MTNSPAVSVGGGCALQRGYWSAQQPEGPRKWPTAQHHCCFGGEDQLFQLQAAELTCTEAAGSQEGTQGAVTQTTAEHQLCPSTMGSQHTHPLCLTLFRLHPQQAKRWPEPLSSRPGLTPSSAPTPQLQPGQGQGSARSHRPSGQLRP